MPGVQTVPTSQRAWLSTVWRTCLAFAVAVAIAAVAPPTSVAAEPSGQEGAATPSPPEFPRLRLGAVASLGGLAAPSDPPVRINDQTTSLYSLGFGGDLRLGVELAEWFSLDLSALAETALLAGDMRIGGLVEFAPSRFFAFALGGGVGTMFIANFVATSPSADFGSGVLRLEGRVSPRGGDQRALEPVFGLEGQLGDVFAGDLPPGTILVGGRAFGGVLWH